MQSFSGVQKITIAVLSVLLVGVGYFFYSSRAGTEIALTLTTNPALERGLVGHWTFDGQDMVWSSTTAEVRDGSGQENHGNARGGMSGTTSPVQGVLGQGMRFSGWRDGGLTEYVTIGDVPELTDLDQKSVCIWFNADTSMALDNGSMVSKFSPGGWKLFLRDWYNDGKPRVSYQQKFDTQYGEWVTGNEIRFNQWYHICLLHDNTSDLNNPVFYLDGQLISGSDWGTPNGVAVSDAGIDFELASDLNTKFVGFLDDVRIYNRILNADEVKRLYQLGATTKVAQTITTNPDLERGLVGHWTFDGQDVDWSSTTAEIRDRSGNGNHADADTVSVASVVGGPIGQALAFLSPFDGPDNNVGDSDACVADTTGNDFDFADGEKFTLAGWLKPLRTDLNEHYINKSLTWYEGYGLSFTLGVLHFYVGNGVDDMVFDMQHTLTDPVGRWHHFTAVWGETYTELYVDGALVDSQYSGLEEATSLATDGDFCIGSRHHGYRPAYGYMDDIRVYNRALSAEEAKRLYELGATTKVAQTITTNPDLERGLVGHWTFDGQDVDWSSTTAEIRDRSGNNNHADIDTWAYAVTPGVLGQAVKRATTTYSRGDIANPISLNIGTGDMTVSAWTKFDTDENGITLFYKKNGGEDVEGINITQSNSSCCRRVGVLISDGNTHAYHQVEHPNLTGTGWHHVTSVIDRDTETRLYLDGVFYGSTTGQLYNGVDISNTDFAGLILSDHMGVNVDDVRIYNRALSPEEVKRLYELGATTKVAQTITTNPDLERGLVGHWTFDGQDVDWSSTTAEIRDRSGQGNHADADTVSVASVVGGPIGQALAFLSPFDGPDNNVGDSDACVADTTGNDFDFADGEKFTLAGWLKPLRTDLNEHYINKSLTWYEGYGLSFTLGVLHFYVGNGVDDIVFDMQHTLTDPVGRWHHFTAVWGETYTELYVDGALVDSQYSGLEEATSLATDGDFCIGSRHHGYRPAYGYMDDIRVYNRALSADEIKRLYELGM